MNGRVLCALIERISKIIYSDKKVLTQMILKNNRVDSIELWYLNSMQGLAFASVNNIPLCDNFKKFTELKSPSFQLDEADPIYRKLLENLSYHKRAVALAAADTIGQVHKQLQGELYIGTLINHLIGTVLAKGMADLAQICERITNIYPELLSERRLFLKVIGMLSNLSGLPRANLLRALNYYLPIAREQGNHGDVEEICG